MRPIFAITFATITLMTSTLASAQDHMHHPKHLTNSGNDNRILVNMPPEIRQHTLTDMRDHLQALSDILAAMARAQYTDAARLASSRLGTDSPSAEGCQDEDTRKNKPQMSKMVKMDHPMAKLMPEGMRKIGLEMHQSANNFANEANTASKTGDPRPALAALSKVTQQCASCHSTYRVQ